MNGTAQQFAVEVQTVSCDPDDWTGNALRFDSVEEAREYGVDLWSRWTAVSKWRVVDQDGKVHYAS